MRLLTTIHAGWRWRRFVAILILGSIAAFLALFTPQIIMGAVLVALLLLVWERMQHDARTRELAARIAAGDLETKLEVRADAWGALCHAVNGLLQQQRLHQRARQLLPALPSQALTALNDAPLPPDGAPRPLTVLIVGYAAGNQRSDAERLAALRALAAALHPEVERHAILLQRCGDILALTFGAFEEQPANATLRSALQVARNLNAAWNAAAASHPLTLSLTCGAALTVALPSLGYTTTGPLIDQALRLYHIAAANPHYALLCNEEAYLALRRFSPNPWQLTSLRLTQPESAAQKIYALPR